MVELGRKHECDDCGVKVYDLGRSEVPCPKCGRDLLADEASAPAAEEPSSELEPKASIKKPKASTKKPKVSTKEKPEPKLDEDAAEGEDLAEDDDED